MISIRYSIYITCIHTSSHIHIHTLPVTHHGEKQKTSAIPRTRPRSAVRHASSSGLDFISGKAGKCIEKTVRYNCEPQIHLNSLDFTSLFCFIWVAILWYRQWFAIALNSCCWCWFRSMPVWMVFFGWSTSGCFAARVTIRSFCSTDHRAVARHWQLKPSLRCYACRFMCPRMP